MSAIDDLRSTTMSERRDFPAQRFGVTFDSRFPLNIFQHSRDAEHLQIPGPTVLYGDQYGSNGESRRVKSNAIKTQQTRRILIIKMAIHDSRYVEMSRLSI